jgi:cytidylate kinase
MKITVSGKIGAGKTTISKALAEKLKLKYLSTGDVMRELAEEKGMSIAEFIKLAEKETKYHKELDKKTTEIGEKQDGFVFDSRLAFHFIPDSIKIFLKVSEDVAAQRLFDQKREGEKENMSLEKTKKAIIEREKSDVAAFQELYNINHLEDSNYDLIIDTTDLGVGDTLKKIIGFLTQKQKL